MSVAQTSEPMAGLLVDPVPKRPRALDPAPQAASRQMDAAEVAAGLCDVHGLVVRDEAFAAQLADVVDANAVILTEVLVRLKGLEAMVGQQGADALQLKDYTVQEDARIDTQLRHELGVMTQRLVDHDAELKGKLATEADKVAAKLTSFEDVLARFQLAASAAPPQPGVEPPGIAALDGLRVAVSAVELEIRSVNQKLDSCAAGVDSNARKVSSVNVGLEGLKTYVVSAVSAAQAQPAADSFQTSAGDPWGRGGASAQSAPQAHGIGTPPQERHPHE